MCLCKYACNLIFLTTQKFFRRGLAEHGSYTCKTNKACVINPRTRNACRYCRYQKCLSVGMSRDGKLLLLHY